MKNSSQAAIRATIDRSKSIESYLGCGAFGTVRLAVVAFHDLDEGWNGKGFGQEAGAIELAQPRRRHGRGADDVDGRPAGLAQDPGAQETPARLAGQVDVQKHDRRPEAPANEPVGFFRRRGDPNLVAACFEVLRDDRSQRQVVLDDQDSGRDDFTTHRSSGRSDRSPRPRAMEWDRTRGLWNGPRYGTAAPAARRTSGR